MNENLYYRCKQYDISTGKIVTKLLACEVVEHSVLSKIKIRLTAHMWNGQPNAVISVLKKNVINYIDPNKQVKECKQFKD